MLNAQKHTILYTAILLWLCVSVHANEVTVAFVNGAPQGIQFHDKDNWTMFVSPYMVVTAERFTKHYYAGSQRIASKIGVGVFDNLYVSGSASVTAGQKDYGERMNLITQSRAKYYAALGIPPGPPTAKGIYGEAEYRGSYGDFMTAELEGDYNVPDNWPQHPYKRPAGGTPGPPVMYTKPVDPDTEGAGYGYSNAEGFEEDVFFYHSDHLGSTSYITDKDGEVTQFVSYKPYGELLVDEHAVSFDAPYKFNGKELDSETGLYYYGARYYEPVVALWYGVDALAEKYPSVGSYVYCAGNPVKLVDSDGNDWITAEYEGETFHYYDSRIHSQDDIKQVYYNGRDVDMNIKYEGAELNINDGNNNIQLMSDGFFSVNGELSTKEYGNDQGSKFHVGTDLYTDNKGKSKARNNTFYGNYAGGRNPTFLDEHRNAEKTKYSYAMPPVDLLDYAAFKHDRGYDKVGAVGFKGAFF